MKESIKMYRSMRDTRKRVLSQNPEYWTGASERMYQYTKGYMISSVMFWLGLTVGCACVLIYILMEVL